MRDFMGFLGAQSFAPRVRAQHYFSTLYIPSCLLSTVRTGGVELDIAAVGTRALGMLDL
jgi:hypothetical protein